MSRMTDRGFAAKMGATVLAKRMHFSLACSPFIRLKYEEAESAQFSAISFAHWWPTVAVASSCAAAWRRRHYHSVAKGSAKALAKS
jgi:hypothetical protein